MAHTKITRAYSANTGTANTFSYSGSFNVFKGSEVVVELDNVALTYTSGTINESASPREYTVDTSAKTIHIGGADLSSGSIEIRPVTDAGAPTARATFSAGSSITASDLNDNQTQALRLSMEFNENTLNIHGDTMEGDLTMGEDTKIIFEGATDDGYETTLTVTDPTADRTITLPNVTGTVVTTGDTATITSTMLGANCVDSSELVDGSIDTSHIADSQVTTAKIAADAVTGAKIADDAIDSEHYTDGSIDTAHIADSQVTTAKIADANVTTAKLASDAVTTAKITDGNVTTAKIAADAITGAKIADDAIDSEHLAADSIDAEHYAPGSVDTTALASTAVTTAKIAADAITGGLIADDAINSEHYTDASIDTAHIADGQITAAKVASNAVTTAKITDSNVTTAKIADSNVTLAKLASDLKQTSISNSDTQLPTSGAVVDYVAAQIAPIGGLEVIADEDNFPSTQPASGVVISISDAAGIVVNGSGTSTTARTAGNGSDNVTINNFPSSLYSETLASGVGLMVSSTGSSNTYNYHKILAAESDVKQLSDDINDFNARYRVNAGEPSSNNDEGDLCYDTNADKMKVYDSSTSAWKEVTSTGDFKYLVLTNTGTTDAATFNNSNTSFDLKETSTSGSAASVTSAAQLMVSVNGVIQKPNTGTSTSGLDGFVLTDADTIQFCAAIPSGADVFIIQSGSAVTVPTPGDGTVTTAKIASSAVTTAKIADANVTNAKLASDVITEDKVADDAIRTEHLADQAVTTALIADSAVNNSKLGADCISEDKIADDAVREEHLADNAVTTARIANDAINGSKIADDAIDSEHYVDGSIDTAHIGDNQVTSAKIGTNQVTSTEIADDAVGSDQLAAGALQTEHCGDNQISEVKLQISNSPTNGQFLSAQSGNTGGLTWATPSGAVKEQFFSPCDGSSISLNQGSTTLGDVTAVHTPGTTFADVPGSSIAYVPPSGTTQVIYEFNFNYHNKDSDPYMSFMFFIDSDEVTQARWGLGGQYNKGNHLFKWGINIGGTADTTAGRLASWTSSKTLKMQAINYSSSREGSMFQTSHWTGPNTAGVFSCPSIGITAVG